MTNEEALSCIGTIRFLQNHFLSNHGVFTDRELEDIETVIKKLKQTRWIPVSERLPVLTGKYLVTVKNGNVYAAVFDSWSGRFQCAATAWMPLPEPYKAESEGNK